MFNLSLMWPENPKELTTPALSLSDVNPTEVHIGRRNIPSPPLLMGNNIRTTSFDVDERVKVSIYNILQAVFCTKVSFTNSTYVLVVWICNFCKRKSAQKLLAKCFFLCLMVFISTYEYKMTIQSVNLIIR